MRQGAAERTNNRDDADGHGRTCALTRARRPQDALIRFVLAPDGTVVPDLKERLPGRGLWLTASGDVVADAVKRRFRPLLQSRSQGSRRASGNGRAAARPRLSALALANKAGEATFGNAKVEEAIAGGRVLALIHAKEAAEDGYRKLDGKARAQAQAARFQPVSPSPR